MDDRYLCPDCYAEHAEPLDASLGHVARCLTCDLLDGAFRVPVQVESIRETVHVEIHIAA